MLAVAAAEPNCTSGVIASMADLHVCAPIDAHGNLTADGTRTFEWDARKQLVAINVGTHRSEYAYDGLRRRVRMVEKENGVAQSDTKVVWCESEICEERAADGTTVTRRAFGQGEQVAGVARFFASDHLGSVTEVTDNTNLVISRYSFDPWGRRTVTAGTDVTSVGFTGHRWEAAGSTTGLALSLHRAYDPELGRWISPDPLPGAIFLPEGPNLFAYGANSPTQMVDPLGLACGSGWSEYAVPDSRGVLVTVYDFTSACANHDRCYEQCKTTKEQCDSEFYKDMLQECSRLKGWRSLYKRECQQRAWLYYQAVVKYGDKPYRECQEKCKEQSK